ncbi:hypothetical protein S2091_0989 [Solimicrobium silvestre]|uniref:Uncharacterized protein n=1 Tax=Solimicrobium silvestre TaxID=2099400 RepID=A0A2S9H317_9BURK|nr:hypothetical protein S2091_0989 [Solimicrobium silvestre]
MMKKKLIYLMFTIVALMGFTASATAQNAPNMLSL